MSNISLFAQIISLLPREKFAKLVEKHRSDYCSKGINSWSHLVSMLFCQFAQATSVRDISNGLRSITGNIVHLGVRRAPSKSSLSYINSHRTADLFKDFYFVLLEHLTSQTSFARNGLGRLKRKIYLLDASIIPLCMSLFDWAKFRTTKGAVKLHMVLDYDGCLPIFADLSHGNVHEINIARKIDFPKDSVVVFDMGYLDFDWLHVLDSKGIFFVTRLKENILYSVKEQFSINQQDQGYILEDSDIWLTNPKTMAKYSKQLRLVRIWDSKNQSELVFLTNNFKWNARTIAEIYKNRWYIESFFKDIKQLMEIKSFIGTTENAVRIQIWTALITMLVLKFLKEKAKYQWHMSNLATFIRLNLFVKIHLFDWINEPFFKIKDNPSGQLDIFSG